MTAEAWNPIDTAPRDGTVVRLNHSQSVPGYACKGYWTGQGWAMDNFFVGRDQRLYMQPDQWRTPSAYAEPGPTITTAHTEDPTDEQ